MRWTGIGLALLLAGGASAGPRDVVEDCARRAPPEQAGLEALEAQCPQLREALDALGVRALLSATTREAMLASSLEPALELMEPAASAARRPPDPTAIAAALQAIGAPATPSSWWDRLKAWLLERLGRPVRADGKADWADWLVRQLQRLSVSQAVLGVLYVTLLVVVVIAAAAVVVNELRVAGILRGRARLGRAREIRPPWAGTGPAGAPPRDALDSGAAPERARQLLQRVVELLTAAGRLDGDRSLTHRELARRARLDDEAARRQLAGLAALAERQLFGAAALPGAALEPALADGRALVAALSRAAGRSP